MTLHQENITEHGYEEGWQDGFDACQKRFIAILKLFPLQCAHISNRLPLHPSQPDQILEPQYWLHAQGHTRPKT